MQTIRLGELNEGSTFKLTDNMTSPIWTVGNKQMVVGRNCKLVWDNKYILCYKGHPYFGYSKMMNKDKKVYPINIK